MKLPNLVIDNWLTSKLPVKAKMVPLAGIYVLIMLCGLKKIPWWIKQNVNKCFYLWILFFYELVYKKTGTGFPLRIAHVVSTHSCLLSLYINNQRYVLFRKALRILYVPLLSFMKPFFLLKTTAIIPVVSAKTDAGNNLKQWLAKGKKLQITPRKNAANIKSTSQKTDKSKAKRTLVDFFGKS